MFSDWLLSMLQTIFLWAMWVLDVAMVGPPIWINTAIGSVQTVLGTMWAFNYWMPFEWFVPVGLFVISVKFPVFLARVVITVWNIVRGSGA